MTEVPLFQMELTFCINGSYHPQSGQELHILSSMLVLKVDLHALIQCIEWLPIITVLLSIPFEMTFFIHCSYHLQYGRVYPISEYV
jgi:hypothetical protein